MTITYTLAEISEVARKLISQANHKILLFDAEMGMGKTTLITEICKQLGVTDSISSPTYSLVNEYEGNHSLIYHFDFYRIKDEEEAYQIGFEEYLERDAWIFIEWPDKIKNLLPSEVQKVKIEQNTKGKRVLFLG